MRRDTRVTLWSCGLAREDDMHLNDHLSITALIEDKEYTAGGARRHEREPL
jgi:hypothetical protein